LNDHPVILEVEDLRVEFDTNDGIVHAVNGISYNLHESESLGIVGESGCGKTVSVLSIMRLLPEPAGRIVDGRVIFHGNNLLTLSRKAIQDIRGRQIAMIYQDPMTSLNPVLTIGYQLTEAIHIHLGFEKKDALDKAIDLLQTVGIPEARQRINDYPHQFSGGMRQRVMIAMALSCSPSLIIADEPTTALDVTIQAQIVDLLKKIRYQIGMSLIWITHDLGVIAGLAHRVIVMYAGYIVEEALVDDLYAHPLHPYTRALLQSLPRLDRKSGEKLATIQGLPPDLFIKPVGCPFAERCAFHFERCFEENPTLDEVERDHKVACWLQDASLPQ
jgi:oligopeptide transport system ATP-binding protein